MSECSVVSRLLRDECLSINPIPDPNNEIKEDEITESCQVFSLAQGPAIPKPDWNTADFSKDFASVFPGFITLHINKGKSNIYIIIWLTEYTGVDISMGINKETVNGEQKWFIKGDDDKYEIPAITTVTGDSIDPIAINVPTDGASPPTFSVLNSGKGSHLFCRHKRF